MSAMRQEQANNVVSIVDALRDAYNELVAWDQHAHKVLGHLRTRLHALELAQDPTFQKEVAAGREQLAQLD